MHRRTGNHGSYLCSLSRLMVFNSNDDLDDVGDDDANEDYKREAEDTVLAESTVQNATTIPALPKDIGRQLSKKELKQVTAQIPWDPGSSKLLYGLVASRSLRRGNARDYP
jgi:hypothetical protein